MNIGLKIKTARNEAGLTQEYAAELLGVSYTHFRNLERQNTFPFKRRMVGTAVRYRNTDVIEYLLNLPEVEPNE